MSNLYINNKFYIYLIVALHSSKKQKLNFKISAKASNYFY